MISLSKCDWAICPPACHNEMRSSSLCIPVCSNSHMSRYTKTLYLCLLHIDVSTFCSAASNRTLGDCLAAVLQHDIIRSISLWRLVASHFLRWHRAALIVVYFARGKEMFQIISGCKIATKQSFRVEVALETRGYIHV